jgi:hypothetical protein
MVEQAQRTTWRVVLHFSGSGYPDAAQDNERAFNEWLGQGGQLELHLVHAVSMASSDVLSEVDVRAVAALLAQSAEKMPPCCSPRVDHREQIAAVDLLLQAWLLSSSDDGPWPRLRRELVGNERLEKLRLELAKRLLTHEPHVSSVKVFEGFGVLSNVLSGSFAEEVTESNTTIEIVTKLREAIGRHQEREALI